jgi:hypothetical protein
MADNTIAITAGTGTNVRTITNAGVDGGAHQQVMTLADAAGNTLGTTATPFPVTIGADADTVSSGTITATDAVVAAPVGDGALLTGTPTASSTVTVTCPGGDSTWDAQVSGTFGGGTVYFEGSFDSGTSWLPLNGRQTGVVNTVLGFSTSTAGAWRGNTSGVTHIRARIKGATTPSVAVTLRVAAGVGAIFLNASVPAGTNSIGTTVQSPLFSGTATNTVAVNATPGATGTIGHAAATITAAVTTAAPFIAAPGAGLSIYITDVNVTNSGATASRFDLFSGAQTVPLASMYAAATTTAPSRIFHRTPIRVGTATALNYTNSAASTSIFAQVTYYIAP